MGSASTASYAAQLNAYTASLAQARITGPEASHTDTGCSSAIGKRFALPNARIMIHQPHGGSQGVAADIEIQAREVLYQRHRLNSILA